MNIRQLKACLVVVAASGLFAAGTAQAADGPLTVTVNATIKDVCKFFTAAPVINITNTGTGSNIDPSIGPQASGNALITYRCANGTTPVFTVPATATITCAACAGTPSMTPVITSANTGAGTGMSKNQTLTVTGTILVANYQDMPVGAYTGTMVVSVTP